MRCRAVDGLRMARCRPVSLAVIGRAEMRAAFGDPARHLHRRTGIKAFRLARRAVLWRPATTPLRLRGGIRIPVRGPFPNIADHVVEAKTIGRERTNRRSASKSVVRLAPGKIALPGVCHQASLRLHLVAPGKSLS